MKKIIRGSFRDPVKQVPQCAQGGTFARLIETINHMKALFAPA
jgi:hypothetical protein